MSTVISFSELLRRAVVWVESEREAAPQKALHAILDEACMRFNLGPQEFIKLERLFRATDKREPS